MAGSLSYRLQVDHIYQRRFDQAELAKVLVASHWYIISRRPSVRIIEGSASIDDRILTVDVVSRDDPAEPQRIRTLGSDFGQFETLRDFRVHANGAYFSVQADGQLIHGDAWALASLLSGADQLLARQEVMYIGEAFGTDGSNNAWRRVRNHEKLQRIYEDHVGTDYDIFVAPLSLERSSWSSDDHIDDAEEGPDLDTYYKHFAHQPGTLRKASVDLVEHSLISYFAPHYNEKLTEWRQDSPTGAMRTMRSSGFRLIHVHLSGWWGLARYHSALVPDAHRGHFISHDLPPAPRRPVLRGVATESLSTWRLGANLVRNGQELVADEAELSGVHLRVFGDEAPTLRTPPGTTLPISPPLPLGNESTVHEHTALRTAIEAERDEQRLANEPIMYSCESTYDPDTGTIMMGHDNEGAPMKWPLHDPLTGRVCSAVIFGDPGQGRTNLLRVLLVEAYSTGRYEIAPADVADKSNFVDLFGRLCDHGLIAAGLPDSLRLLESVANIIDSRLAADVYEQPTSELPAFLVAVDDADAVLRDERGAALVSKILTTGGGVGVGLALVLGDIIEFESDPGLMRQLISADMLPAFTTDGHSILGYLRARYDEPRRSSGDEGRATFIIHHTAHDTVLSMAVAWIDAAADQSYARTWSATEIEAISSPPLDWSTIRDDPQSSSVIDEHARRWQLRRHQDVWLLTLVLSNFHGETPLEAIKWAEQAITIRFDVALDSWRLGPGSGAEGQLVLYSDAVGDLISRDQSDSFDRFLAHFI